EHQVKCIFIEPQQNDKAAQVLAKEYQMQIYTLDPLGGSLPVDSVSDLILANWKVMKQAFAQ
ncbi:MAG TPA: metal ABC transporter substrate-binding protein, partial [Candidatus Cloacimonadota bacterium]|nr:metal ABC transporter substrate-binding protein [Candidatus Cloacimonadota bacterium]HPI25613.1 metal ABC transporter substrate-binding protein [Candidatus Cloacimonadota bacterium]